MMHELISWSWYVSEAVQYITLLKRRLTRTNTVTNTELWATGVQIGNGSESGTGIYDIYDILIFRQLHMIFSDCCFFAMFCVLKCEVVKLK